MPLTNGTRLGPYEILGPLGAGGMGEVYKARDTRLDRVVAVKVLPSLFAEDATFRARFEREARAISALNHPHICTLHDVGEHGVTAYLVMEYVEGEPPVRPMPPARAIPIAIQICDALDAAHRAGIVHRDLKPSNILLAGKADSVKLLDFGLASRPVQSSGQAGVSAVAMTVTGGLTGAHTVVGTPQYMAPEQIERREADARTDIFALGCVLYQLLTGKPAFEGKTASGVMAAILATEPRPLRELQPVTPPALEWIVTRCLAKDPDERWQTVRDLRAALDRVLQELSAAVPAAAGARPASLPWAIAAVAIAAAIGIAVLGVRFRTAEPVRDDRVFTSLFVPPTNPSGPPALRLAMSPDGTRLAYVAPDENGRILLWIRPLDSLVAQPLAGTLNASSPFWSPDGRSVAFIANGLLKRIDAAGGPVITICPAVAAPFGTWNREDVIVFTGADDALARVSADGGVPVAVTAIDQTDTGRERIHITPYFLPDGRHFLYAAGIQGSRVKAIKVGSLDSSETRVVLESTTSNAMYADGFLLFLRDTTLMAQPFDAASLTLGGEARPLAEHVQINPTTGTGAFTVSQQGVLAYQASTHGGGTVLAWLNRTGERIGIVGDAGGYMDVRLAPDGRRASIVMAAPERRGSDLWLLDTARNLRTRFTFGSEFAAGGVWSPDGSRIAYSEQRADGPAMVIKSSSGAGREEVLVADGILRYPLSWSPDGQTLLCDEARGGLNGSLCVLRLDGDRTPRRLLGTAFSEVPAVFSPDGRWVAYVSNESGQKEVYVTSFPDLSGKWQVSSSGYGDFPRWRADGKEIFFLTGDRLMAAEVSGQGSEFQVGAVTPLFALRWPIGVRSVYDVTPDGARFLVNLWDATPDATPVTIVVNWPARLRAK